MTQRLRALRPGALALALGVIVATLAACGGGGDGASGARGLLKDTFSGGHDVHSGRLAITLRIAPRGGQGEPISFTLNGPFQSAGGGQLPKFHFTLAGSLKGASLSAGATSTAAHGYVQFMGTSYQIPDAIWNNLRSSYRRSAGSKTRTGPGIAGLGIDPLRWLRNPHIVGSAQVGGADTTHIVSAVDVRAFVSDLNPILSKAASLGALAGRGPGTLSPRTKRRIVHAVRSASVGVWTGKSDHTLRKFQLHARVVDPKGGGIAGIKGANVTFTGQLTDLNQSQSIAAPAHTQPLGRLLSRLGGLGSLGGLLGGGGSGLGGGSGGGSSGSHSASPRLRRCLKHAGTNIAQARKCAKLLGGGG